MDEGAGQQAAGWARRWVRWLAAHQVALWLMIVAVTVGAFVAAGRLRFDGDLARLLPEDTPSVRGLRQLDSKWAGQVGRLTLVLKPSGQLADAELERVADALAASLQKIEGVDRVEVRDPLQELLPKRLLYMDLDDVKEVSRRLTRRIRWERARANPFFVDLGEPAPEVKLDDIKRRYEARAGEGPKRPGGWYRGEDGALLVFVHPDFAASDLNRSKALVASVREGSAKVLKAQGVEGKLGVSITGRYAKRIEQQELLTQDVAKGSGLALLLVIVFLTVYLRSIGAALEVFGPLVVGTIWTFALCWLWFDSLNLLTGFLGAILMGLGVDHGIHLSSQLSEARRAHERVEDALASALGTAGRATIYAGLTTLLALGSMGVSSFRAFREFGICAVMGMTSIVAAYMVVLPLLAIALDRLSHGKPRRAPLATPLASALEPLVARATPRWRAAGLGALVLAGALSIGAAQARFDDTFDSLTIRDTPSWALDQQVNTILGRSQTPAVVLVEDDAHRQRVLGALRERKANAPQGYTIDRALSLQDLLPAEQDAKLTILKQLQSEVARVPASRRSDQLKEVAAEVDAIVTDGPMTPASLPRGLSLPFMRKDATEAGAILVFPGVDLSQARPLLDFAAVVRDLPGPTPNTTTQGISDSQLLSDILTIVPEDLEWMVLLTAIGVLIVVLFAFGFAREVPLLVGALVLAMLAATGATALMGQKFNFLNALILPIWLGMGVDASFHTLIHRRDEPGQLRPQLATGASIAASLTTSAMGFGAMMVARHVGLSSLGRTAVVGLAVILVVNLATMLVLLPPQSPPSRGPLAPGDLG